MFRKTIRCLAERFECLARRSLFVVYKGWYHPLSAFSNTTYVLVAPGRSAGRAPVALHRRPPDDSRTPPTHPLPAEKVAAAGAAVVIVLDRWFNHALSAALHVPVIQVAVALAALRVGLAVMQWVSRVYVLTNRRIMRIRGVFRADLFACPLVQIIGSQVTAGPHEAVLRLGTIRFNTGHTTGDGSWYHVARPDEVHAEIRRALERAIDRHP